MVASAAPGRRRPRCVKVLKVGTDFSGVDTCCTALHRMGIEHTLEFASDSDPACRKVLEHVHKPVMLHPNILDRSDEVAVDLYVWTPPCQDFSSAGKRAGVTGKRQVGNLISASLKYIKNKSPRVTVFENVPTLLSKKFVHVAKGIVRCQQQLGYKVHTAELNSKHYSLPQDRRRVFIVGIRSDSVKHKFHFPARSAPVKVASILDPLAPTDKPGRLPDNKRGKQRCLAAYKHVFLEKGVDPRRVPVMVDIDCSERFSTFGIDEARTVTKSRGGSGGPWVSSRGRRVTISELMRLQGLHAEDIPAEELGLSARQVGQMVGNAVPVNTMGCILAEALSSAGLTKKKHTFPM